jgi:hypothetical protein
MKLTSFRVFPWVLLAGLALGLLIACQPQPATDEAEPASDEGTAAEESTIAETTAPPAVPPAPPARTSTTPRTPAPPAAPPPPPQPRTEMVRLPAGTTIDVEFVDSVSSGANLAGDSFRARVASDVAQGGRVVIPAGSDVRGMVEHVESIRNKKVGGRAKMELFFDRVSLATGDVAIMAYLSHLGKSETGKDAATIGGATAAGAIIGHQVDDDSGKIIGAIVGAAAGTAVATQTKGKEIELPAGTTVTLELASPVDVELYR